MPKTQVKSPQIFDGGVSRADLNVSGLSGSTVIARAAQGAGIILSSTGTDSGTGDVTIGIATSGVTLAMMADVVTASVFYRKTAGTGAPEVQTLATLKTDLGLTGTNSGDQTITLTGDVTGSGTSSFAATIASQAVTYAKIQNVTATDRVLGRSTAGAGVIEEIIMTAAGRALMDDTTAAAQRTTLGGTTVGQNFFTLTNPGGSGETFIRINDTNTLTALSASAFRTSIGAGTGNGTVTAVSIATANGFSGSSSGGATPALTISLALTGDVTTSGAAATIAVNAITTTKILDANVTLAKIQNIATLSVLGRSLPGVGVTEMLTGTNGQVLRVSGTTLGFGTLLPGSIAVSANSRLLGRGNPPAASPNAEEIVLGPGLAMKNNQLSSTVFIDLGTFTGAPSRASAATLDLSSTPDPFIDITGTTNISAITLDEGEVRSLRFTGAGLTLEYSASLLTLGGVDLPVTTDGVATIRGGAGGVVTVVAYQNATNYSVQTFDNIYIWSGGNIRCEETGGAFNIGFSPGEYTGTPTGRSYLSIGSVLTNGVQVIDSGSSATAQLDTSLLAGLKFFKFPNYSGTFSTITGVESLTNKKLGSLTTNGFVRTNAGDGTLSVDTASYEPALGNPGTTGFVLSSTTGGTRSWIAAGTGTVTNFSAGDLSPLFTTSEATTTTTPALTFSLSSAAANTLFGNFTGSTAAPSYNAIAAGIATFLATPSSANLLAAVTGPTGTGALMFGTAPTVTGLLTEILTPGANTIGYGLSLLNNTAATAGNPQFSPALHWKGNSWYSDAASGPPVPVNQSVEFRAYVKTFDWDIEDIPGKLILGSSVDGAAFEDWLTIDTFGTVQLSEYGVFEAYSIRSTGPMFANSVQQGFATRAASGTPVVLLDSSPGLQYVTGTNTTQTITLPIATTLTVGHRFIFKNQQTGTGNVLVRSSGTNTVITLAPGTSATVTCVDPAGGTGTASWSFDYFGTSITSAKKLTVTQSLTLAGTDTTTHTFPSTSSSVARIDAAQSFTGDQTFGAKIIGGAAIRLKGYTVAGLPAGTQGDTAYATDLLTPTYLVAAVGGGAVVGPVFHNGTAWVSA